MYLENCLRGKFDPDLGCPYQESQSLYVHLGVSQVLL